MCNVTNETICIMSLQSVVQDGNQDSEFGNVGYTGQELKYNILINYFNTNQEIRQYICSLQY